MPLQRTKKKFGPSTVTPKVFIVLVVMAVLLLFSALVFIVSCSNLEAASYESSNAQTVLPAAAIEDTETLETRSVEQEFLETIQEFYFYEKERIDRYVAFSKVYPDLSPEQVVVRVNTDLDQPAYEYATPVDDPDSLIVMVSKHFYLPYDYIPADLVSVTESIQLRASAATQLHLLITAAESDGLRLYLGSGFRSATEQEYLYNGYAAYLGADIADIQSARSCFSEHQTGLVVDFSPADSGFYNTPEAYWIEQNAYKYGFIVRYLEGNEDITLFIHEPWHIRYVGVEVAEFMHANGITSLEEYWVKYVQHKPPSVTSS